MSFVKPVQLSALALLAAALFLPTPALAAGAIKLLPTDVEPNASGEVRWEKGRLVGFSSMYGALYSANVRVTCKGLTPGGTYWVCCAALHLRWGEPFIADEAGGGSWEDLISWWNVRPSIEVWNDANELVLTQ